MMKLSILKTALVLLVLSLTGCSSLRTEFFRGETRYLYNSGCRYYKQGDYDAAREAFEKVLVMDPDYGPASGALGNLALVREKCGLALAHYRKAIQADPVLEADLRALILAATAHSARKPLAKAGMNLRQVYLLMMADKQAELEVLFSNDVPLDLLARDTLTITPSELGELRRKAAATADPGKNSVRYRLFAAYLLFYGRTDSALAAALIEQAAPQAKSEEMKKAYVLLGQLHERLGNFNLAVNGYLAAVDAGLPLANVAHHLARIYKVDIKSILPENEKLQPVPPPPRVLRIELSLPVPKPVSLKIGFERSVPEIGQKVLKGRGLL